MYKKFFGFTQKPFSVTPDPTFYYPSQSHREGLASLRYGIRERMGFVVLTGEIGVGKTFLIRSLLQELGDDVKRALILNPILEPDELFRSILEDLEVPFEKEDGFVAQLEAFNKYLLNEHEQGNLVVLIVDESQDLSTDALERLRLLSNLETETAKLLQIVLVGQPELNDLLALPVLRQLDQRIAMRHQLDPFTKTETPEYIGHRLNVASEGEPKVSFDSAAIRRIYRASGGLPRVVGLLCDHALNSVFSREERVVTAKTAKEAISKVRNRAHSNRLTPAALDFGIGKWAPATIGVVCLIVGFALSFSSFFSDGPGIEKGVSKESSLSPHREPQVVTAFPQPHQTAPADSASPIEDAKEPSVVESFESNLELTQEGSPKPTSSDDDSPIPAEEVEEDSIWGEDIGGVIEETVDSEGDSASEVTVSGEPIIPAEQSIEQAPVPRGALVLESAQAPVPRDPEAVTELESAKIFEPIPVMAPQESSARYGLQVASLQSLERAQRLADEIKRFGPVFLAPWSSEKSGEWIRVVLGAYPDRRSGEEALDLLAKESWAQGARVVENRWWRQVAAPERKGVFALARE